MKHMLLIFIGSLLFLIGCSESTKKSSNTNICAANPHALGCYSNPGTSPVTPPVSTCDMYPQREGCPAFCTQFPGHFSCSGAGAGGNPYPNYYSGYVDKNWLAHYTHIPSISCSDATVPPGLDYTPHETRKGSVTLKGQESYDPSSGQAYFDTTSELLRSVNKAKQFFWADSVLKVRFKANLQPKSSKTTTVCPGRAPGQSSLKGYGKIKFDLFLIGIRANGTTSTIDLGTQETKVNSCTQALNLSHYAAEFPNGIYLKISNVHGNQGWMAGTNQQQETYDLYGYITPQNPYVENTWELIRNAECWSLDIEVAADGTKTFN